jgi:GT2 family glycosyltransferase
LRDFLLVVVDNSSTDSSAADTEAFAAVGGTAVYLLRSPSNVGVAAANNLGVDAARRAGTSEAIVIVNNDTGFGPDFLSRLCRDRQPRTLVSPVILDHDSNRVWFAGGSFRRFMSTVHDGFGDIDQPSAFGAEARTTCEYAPTTCLLVPVSAFDTGDVGRFHEPYFCYFDDADWVLRARRTGYTILVDHGCLLRHYEGGSSGGNRSAFSLYYLTRNRLIFVARAQGLAAFAVAACVLLAFVIATSMFEPRRWHYLRHRTRGWLSGLRTVLVSARRQH